MEAADADPDEGSRRHDRHLRSDVHALGNGFHEAVSDHQPHLSGSAVGKRGHAEFLPGPLRQSGNRRVRLHCGGDRRHGDARAVQGVPRHVLRRHGRQHDPRSDRRNETAGGAPSIHRHREGGHLGALRRGVRHRGGDVPAPGLLRRGRCTVGQSRQSQLRGRLG